MADFFPCLNQEPQKRTEHSLKRKGFHQQIRSKTISDKIRQKRILGSDGPHIEAMIKGLPLSWQETVICMKKNPQYCEAITSLIIDKVHPVQLSLQKIDQKDSVHFLLPENQPQMIQEFLDEVYFFAMLLQYQGIYSANIFKRYLLILLEHARSLHGLHLIFNLFIEVLKRPELNWAPIEQIIETIVWIEKGEEQKQSQITREEVEVYFYLISHYYHLVQKAEKISNRIRLILQKGADSLEQVKPSLFFKLCFQLTHFENPSEENTQDHQIDKPTQPNRFFHEAMLKGGIIKTLYRHLFFSSKEKLKYLCLDILNNLIIEYDGMILWADQPFNPIEKFDEEIRNQTNTANLFKQFCSVFLNSILELPSDQIENLFEKQINTLELILYILEKVDPDSHRGKQIYQRAQQCLYFILNEANIKIQQTLVQTLLDHRWKIVLGPESELIYECDKRASIQP